MVTIKLDKDVIEYSRELVLNNNFGQRGYDDGNVKQQFIGIVSENTVRKYLGYKAIEPTGFDGGYDILYKGLRLDIKSMGRNVDPKPNYINNVFDAQIKHKSDGFIFTSLNIKNKTLTICGWITKSDFIKKGLFYSKGSERKRGKETFKLRADNWEILNKDLSKLIKNK